MASQHGQAAAIVGGLAPERVGTRLVEVLTDEADLVHATFSVAGRRRDAERRRRRSAARICAGAIREPWWDVERQVVRAQPFFRYVVHDTLAAAGRADLIAAQCRDWSVLLERCPTSWSETWFGGTTSPRLVVDADARPDDPRPRHRTREPGLHHGARRAALGDLAWARGAVPCPGGHVHVDVQSTMLTVDSPLPFVHAGRVYERGVHAIPRGAEGSA